MTTTPDHWPFEDPPNVAVFTCGEITSGGDWIQSVHRDEEDGTWQFLPSDGADMKTAKLVTLRQILEIDPSIQELADLPLRWHAWRPHKRVPWQRAPNERAT